MIGLQQKSNKRYKIKRVLRISMQLQALETLLKFPKKKQIKKLFQHCLVLTNNQHTLNPNFTTPIIQTLKQQLSLSSLEVHRLVLVITNLFRISALVNFDEERMRNVLGGQLDEQLKELVVGMLVGLNEQLKESEIGRVRQGMSVDVDSMDWNLATEIGNQKGKSNTPIVEITLPLSQSNQSKRLKFQMKGEQFEVFFNNLAKIKQTLTDLVAQS